MIVKKKVTGQSKERPSVSVAFVSPTESEQERVPKFYGGPDSRRFMHSIAIKFNT